jgi:hypothetical protein
LVATALLTTPLGATQKLYPRNLRLNTLV